MTLLSVLFLIDGVPSSSTPITSMVWKQQACFQSAVNSSKQSETPSGNSLEEVLFVLSQDGKINVVEGDTGTMISSRPLHIKESTAVSMYVIGKYKFHQEHYIFSFMELGISFKNENSKRFFVSQRIASQPLKHHQMTSTGRNP